MHFDQAIQTGSAHFSSIARHERFGPKVLQEIESQGIQIGTRGLELYDDIPEDNEMTLL